MLLEVDTHMKSRLYLTAVNRLYYSCFHATKALLLTKDLVPKTHSGMIHLLHLHFVQTGIMNTEQAAFLSRLMQERIEDDYSDTLYLSEAEAMVYLEPAKEYVSYVANLIQHLFNTNVE